jgi:hypothetical protein
VLVKVITLIQTDETPKLFVPAAGYDGIEVSDNQKVACACVPIIRNVKLMAAGPMLIPKIVTSVLAVDLMFDSLKAEMVGSIEEKRLVISP